jgi:hypothetical protein
MLCLDWLIREDESEISPRKVCLCMAIEWSREDYVTSPYKVSNRSRPSSTEFLVDAGRMDDAILPCLYVTLQVGHKERALTPFPL